ncbi:MAG: FAD-binding protein, partial [Coriobacteriia bacterium]|nr:FAD-binding protein [Coriobacteriia bacterium]
DGAVIGLIVEDGRRFKANKGVVMCCGGFESDPGMLFDSTGVKGAFPAAGMGNTGDGHRACAKVGAGMWHMHCVSGFWETTRSLDNTRFLQFGPGEGSGPGNYTKDRGITVGMNGQRFYMDWDANTSGGLYPMGSDLTVNIGYRHGYTQWGGQWGPMRMPETAWFVFDANALANGAVPTDLSADPVADGFAYVSDTIEGLAEQCGVPADELANTVAVWNQFCADGEDLAFHRPANTLTEVVTPPFYAVRCAPHFLNTNGGPARSAKGEVLDAFGAPIPGLYSAGEFGSIWGALYQAAGNLAECCAFGRISARSALGR